MCLLVSRLLVILMIIGLFQTSLAMDPSSDPYEINLVTIGDHLLQEMLSIRRFKEWRIGQIHSLHLLLWGYHYENFDPEKMMVINDNEPLRFYVSPPQLALYINEKMPEGKKNFEALQFGTLTSSQLFDLVKNSIDRAVPLLAYVKEDKQVSLNTIIGYVNENNNKKSLKVICTKTNGEEKLKTLFVDDMLKEMDLSTIIATLTSSMDLTSILKPDSLYLRWAKIHIPKIQNFNLIMHYTKQKPKLASSSNRVTSLYLSRYY